MFTRGEGGTRRGARFRSLTALLVAVVAAATTMTGFAAAATAKKTTTRLGVAKSAVTTQENATLSVAVSPNRAGQPVTLQVLNGGWRNLLTARLGTSSLAKFSFRIPFVATRQFRAVKPAEKGYAASVSNVVSVKVAPPQADFYLADRAQVGGHLDVGEAVLAADNTLREQPGRRYYHSLSGPVGEFSNQTYGTQWAAFNLGRKCTRLRAAIGAQYGGMATPPSLVFTVSTDGHQRERVAVLPARVGWIDLNVTGSVWLTLAFTPLDRPPGYGVFGNPVVTCSL